MVLEDLFLLLNFFIRPQSVHQYFYPSIFVFTRPNDGWTGLCIKLWFSMFWSSHWSALACLRFSHRNQLTQANFMIHDYTTNNFYSLQCFSHHQWPSWRRPPLGGFQHWYRTDTGLIQDWYRTDTGLYATVLLWMLLLEEGHHWVASSTDTGLVQDWYRTNTGLIQDCMLLFYCECCFLKKATIGWLPALIQDWYSTDTGLVQDWYRTVRYCFTVNVASWRRSPLGGWNVEVSRNY